MSTPGNGEQAPQRPRTLIASHSKNVSCTDPSCVGTDRAPGIRRQRDDARHAGDRHARTVHASHRSHPVRRRRRPPLVVRPRLRPRIPRAASLPRTRPRAASAVASGGVEPQPLRCRRRAGRRTGNRDCLRRMAVLPPAPPPGSGLVARRHGDARPPARRGPRRRALCAPLRQAVPARGGRPGHSGRVPAGHGTHRQLHRRPDRRRGDRCLVGREVPRRGGLPPSRGALRRRQEPAADGVPAPRAAREPHAGRRRRPVRLLVRVPALLHRPVPRLPHPPACPRHRADAEHRHGGGGRPRCCTDRGCGGWAA